VCVKNPPAGLVKVGCFSQGVDKPFLDNSARTGAKNSAAEKKLFSCYIKTGPIFSAISFSKARRSSFF
jgi:hypothetical protein